MTHLNPFKKPVPTKKNQYFIKRKTKYKIIICKTCQTKSKTLTYIHKIYCSHACSPSGRKKYHVDRDKDIRDKKLKVGESFPRYIIESCGHSVQLHFNALKNRGKLKNVRCQKPECRNKKKLSTE